MESDTKFRLPDDSALAEADPDFVFKSPFQKSVSAFALSTTNSSVPRKIYESMPSNASRETNLAGRNIIGPRAAATTKSSCFDGTRNTFSYTVRPYDSAGPGGPAHRNRAIRKYADFEVHIDDAPFWYQKLLHNGKIEIS